LNCNDCLFIGIEQQLSILQCSTAIESYCIVALTQRDRTIGGSVFGRILSHISLIGMLRDISQY